MMSQGDRGTGRPGGTRGDRPVERLVEPDGSVGEGEQPFESNEPFDISFYPYSCNLQRVSEAEQNGTLHEIEGYDSVGHYLFLAYDMVEGKFIEGANTFDELEDRLVDAFGEDYSLRVMAYSR